MIPAKSTANLTREFGEPAYDLVEAPATPDQKALLSKLSPKQIKITELAGEKIQTVLTQAPGNGAPIGGLKVVGPERMVRGASVRDGRHLQDLCGEFPRSGSSAPHPGGSPNDGQRRLGGAGAGAGQRSRVAAASSADSERSQGRVAL